MSLDSLLEILNRKLVEAQNRPLNATEILILRGIWEYQTYSQIAQANDYSPGYFTNVVAPELCQRLSQLIGSRVTKKNCRPLLESYAAAQVAPETAPLVQHLTDFYPDVTQENISPIYPSGSVPLNSPFYIEHPAIQAQVYEEISKPGALVRIKAPREMGKTSLLLRTLDYAKRLDYRTVCLNLEQIEQPILSDLNRFLRWLCVSVTHQLQLQPRLDEYWDEDIGSNVSCTLYFRGYLLEQIGSPIVLALDEVNQVFEHPQVAKDFLPLLRSWYEEARRLRIWQKLRLIVVHSTEIYVPLHLNQSPFNVGLPIQLAGFSIDQVQQLAQRYRLNWTDGEQARLLMAMVGGHPALVQIALYHLSRGEVRLAQLLETAPTPTGIYGYHLQRHWATLQQQPELAIALHTVMSATEPVQLEPTLAYKLNSIGLIHLDGNKAMPSCQLYRQYFENQQPE
ncbi:AAA-like domain-containing protein [Chroococcidiopsis sp. CCMEE 29]|uniref:AAA-like domain-containing protein n=1 Tax=Chroococcidiopsis sp. CCMEE 29 TaxID=155894 RepID=UPI00202268B0|nr:AAA-like domain-containing protein [Chroococcidiopsis sp. CCMEE 29]